MGEEEPADDPLAGWILDEDFVASATVPEASAEERVRRPEPRPLAPEPRRALRRRGRRGGVGPARRVVVGAIVVLVAVIAAAVVRDTWVRSRDPLAGVAPDDHRVLIDGEEVAFPTPAPASDTPLGTPPEVPDTGSHAMAQVQADGASVAWDPCRPVRYVVAGRPAPAGAEGLLEEAVAEVERATGLVFEPEGVTDEPVAEDRPAIQVERYGDRWAPVLMAWSDPDEVPALAGPVAGRGGHTAFARPGGLLVYTTGTLVLDAPDLADILEQEDGRDQARSVILHELAHLVGLDHVDDPAELMHPVSQPDVTTFGPGDRAGLARLGRGPCVPEL